MGCWRNLLKILTRVFGRRPSDSVDEQEEGSRLLRFFPQSPNFLDDPQNVRLFRERAVKALMPREVDKGRPSYWKTRTALEDTRVKAQMLVRTDKPRKCNVLLLATRLLTRAGFVVCHDRDHMAYPCVAGLHCTIDLTQPSSLDALVETIRSELEAQLVRNPGDGGLVAYERIGLGEVESIIVDAVRDCHQLDFDKAREWVRNIVCTAQSQVASAGSTCPLGGGDLTPL
jgi:hypothetical protein